MCLASTLAAQDAPRAATFGTVPRLATVANTTSELANVVERFTAEMARLVPAARDATVVSSMVTREVAATFRGSPGSAALRPGPVTSLPGVTLAGAWTDTGWPATMEGAVRSGNLAGREVLRQISTSDSRSGAAA